MWLNCFGTIKSMYFTIYTTDCGNGNLIHCDAAKFCFEIGCSTMVVLVVKTQSQSPWPKQCTWLRQFSKYSKSEKTWALLEITWVIWHVFCLSLFSNFSNPLLYFRQRDTTLWCLDTEYKIEMENFLYHKAWIGFFWPGRYSFN